ncbi:hypothetical protein E2P63_05695, partial [Candidatus Bathyarchaeota archaeon]
MTITIKKNEAIIYNTRTEEKKKEKIIDPLSVISKTLRNRPGFLEQRFVGGAVGYIGYDAVRYWEQLPKIAVDDQQFPDVQVGIFDDGIIY